MISLQGFHPFASATRRAFWAECKMALILILLVAAVLAAPQKGSAQNSEYPILGSIAEDLIGLGDLQFGVTEFIFEKSAQHTSKVRHQRVELEGGEIFCTQYPQHIQTNFLGIRISRYYEEYSATLCDIVPEPPHQASTQDASRTPADVTPLQAEELPADWLEGAQLTTERSYCLGRFDSREFTAQPPAGHWIREGESTPYTPDMFAGFTTFKDQERGLVFAISEVLDTQQSREVGCSFNRSKILVKLTVEEALP